MPYPVTRLRQALGDRRNWKGLGWKGIGLVFSAGIIVAALFALAHALRNIHLDEVAAAVWRTDSWRVVLAGTLIAMSYATLTLYDLLALRTIDRADVPYRTAALANFTSYPIGHGIGAMIPISSAIRYRIYSVYGLGVLDVAKVCFLTGLTFWLGNLTALGLSLLYEPEAI